MEQSIRLERRFAIIDEWLLDLDISDRAVRLYAVLGRYADSETHKAYPSRGTLAERLKCSKASVDRASQELVEAGAMTKKQRHNSSVVYTLQVSSPLQRGVLTGDEGGSSGVMRGVLTGDDLTITTELEPKELEPINYIEPKIVKASRMTKLPDDWYPSDRLLEMFATKWPDVDRDYEIEQFINYWHAEGKTKLDWDKAFQVWMARADKQSRGKVAGKRLTNSESAALLAMKYREQAKEIEEPVNYEQVEQIENETNGWFKEID
jgi:hypothetical protein